MKSLNRILLIGLLTFALTPMAFRQLLSFAVHGSKIYPTITLTSGGRHIGRNLMRQLEYQAQKEECKNRDRLLPRSTLTDRELFLCPRIVMAQKSPRQPLSIIFPSGDSVSLRI